MIIWFAMAPITLTAFSTARRLATPRRAGTEHARDHAQPAADEPGQVVGAQSSRTMPARQRHHRRADLVGGEHPAEHDRRGAPKISRHSAIVGGMVATQSSP